ncbi:DUF5329 family protein [Pseudoalteromonas sp. SSDWG2]|uniref:DUF5329 family protein n=1 Tax=Pseudoalteromonas sp. SSDWG2 TaxID=3139391 RepID=UPI003BACD1CC
MKSYFYGALALVFSLGSHAKSPLNTQSQAEIEHLLSFVQTTSCSYERNGKIHTGKEALEHIKKKYAHFADDIHSTEDFITYSATKSKLSGKYYLVHCEQQAPIKSQDWLHQELAKFRAQQHENKKG